MFPPMVSYTSLIFEPWVSLNQDSRLEWESWWVVEGVFGEGVALGTEAPPDSEFISLVINSKLLYSENAVPLIEQAR